MENTKQQVREFYDQIGWSQVGDGLYQNARYEDLRPVSREYIHNCHMRVKRHLAYRLGEKFLANARSPIGWLRIPFVLRGAVISFKQERATQS